MADAYTSTSAVGWDQAAWEQYAYFAFMPETHFMDLATVKPTNQSMPGKTVTFTKVGNLPLATSALSETVDVDAVAMSDSQVTLTLAEYGNAVITTAFLEATGFLPTSQIVAEVLGTNMGQSLDVIFANAAKSGTNVKYAKGTGSAPANRAAVAATNTLTSHDIRVARAMLVRGNVPKFASAGNLGSYLSVIHPDVRIDLEEETGAAGWREAHIYAAPEEIFNGEFGKYQGFRFIETTNAPVFVDAGAGTTVDVYRSLFLGKQALAMAHTKKFGERPQIVPGPVVDKLRRQHPMGWYWVGATGVFRQESLWAIESSSSIATNV